MVAQVRDLAFVQYPASGFTGSHNEWDPLEEVVVGTIDHARKPLLGKDQLAIEYPDRAGIVQDDVGQYSQRVLEETAEDLELFVAMLRRLGVRVRRPDAIEQAKTFGTFDWTTDGFYTYCPRDSMLVVGDKIIETPMTMRSRFLEPFAFKKLLMEYFQDGAKWFSAPKPRLPDETYGNGPGGLALKNLEPVFDAANVLRAGRDLFYLVSDTGNELGARWLQTVLGPQYRVNLCRDLYSGVHIDSTLAFLRPGLMLANPARVNDRNLPERLRRWDKIWCPELVDTGFEGPQPLSSVWVGMNILMINPSLAVVDERQTTLIHALEKHGIDVATSRLRHSRTLGGGFHCVTLDTKRRGNCEDHF